MTEILEPAEPNPFVDKLTRAVIRTELLVPYGSITHKVWRCNVCNSRLEGRDKFCHTCGRLIVSKEGPHDLE